MCVFVVALKIVKHVIKQRIIYKYKIYIKFLISTLCAKLDRQKLLLFLVFAPPLGSFLHYLAVFRLEYKKKQKQKYNKNLIYNNFSTLVTQNHEGPTNFVLIWAKCARNIKLNTEYRRTICICIERIIKMKCSGSNSVCQVLPACRLPAQFIYSTS